MDKLDAILKAHVAQEEDTINKLLGASFIVVNKDGTLYSGSAGRSRMDPSSRPFAADTFTWIASCTKIITSTCVMHLVERGKASLDDDLRPLVPELAAMKILRGFDGEKPILEENTTPITFRILLTHTLGLPYDILDPDLVKWSQQTSRTDWCMTWNRNGFNTPIRFSPGESWLYGPALDWAGFALQAITGDTIGAYMQRHVFDPLGMEDTGFWPKKLKAKGVEERGVEPVERKDGGGGKLDGVNPWEPGEHDDESGGAGLYSTPGDYAKFLQGFLGDRLVSRESMEQMFTPQLNDAQRAAMENIAYKSGEEARLGFAPEFPEGTPISHGLGGVINLKDVQGKRREGSIMWSGMVNSRWWIDRKTGIAAILMVHLMPHGDKVVASLYDQLERGVYTALAENAS